MDDKEILIKIKAHCEERKKYYSNEIDWLLKQNLGHETGRPQHAFRAYVSILEIMDGEEPCDKPYNDE